MKTPPPLGMGELVWGGGLSFISLWVFMTVCVLAHCVCVFVCVRACVRACMCVVYVRLCMSV